MDAPVTVWIGIAGVFLTLVAYAVVATWALAGVRNGFEQRAGRIEERGNEKRSDLESRLAERVEHVRASGELLIRAECEKESKLRHDLANQMTVLFGEMNRNLRDTDQRHAVLEREAIRKSDMAAMELRMAEATIAHEARVIAGLDKLEKKFDGLSELVNSRLRAP